ncbi:UDP-N-acetylglucosamine diphosphorylase/glucosamine-1-phosphate N-acetyltransferase [Spirosomataceae bacterium TFI 002]|nr:UDP-N-acetylglucosamine diphosphorylase/glucosamine-1-phosphate N-acetyltransferase [Spirosomataceae bacterium TFI 002]
MNIILFDQASIRENLKPLSLTRPVARLRVGILTIEEKWQKYLSESETTFLVPSYLSSKFKTNYGQENLYIASHLLPSTQLAEQITNLKINEGFVINGEMAIFKSNEKLIYPLQVPIEIAGKDYIEDVTCINQLPDLFLNNGSQIGSDYELVTAGRVSEGIQDEGSRVYNPDNVFLEKGVHMRACTINAENGPVYIGKNAIIQENSLIIGPACIGENAMVAFGAKIRYNTTLGPGTRVGGEVGNTVFLGNANKAHDGFLGNSVIGEWCNLGANTNNSNLKNNYKNVSLYNYGEKDLKDTGEMFCGVFMGDFTKTGISTMINTGSVFGVSSNIYGAGFQAKFVPSFSWGGKAEGYLPYRFDKAIEVINATMARREKSLTNDEVEILKYINENKEPDAV